MSDTSVKTQPPTDRTPDEPAAAPATPTPVATPRHSRVKTTRTKEILKYAASVLILTLGGVVCYGLSLLKEPPKKQAADQLTKMVSTVEVERFAGQLDMEVSGTVVPYREIRVAAEVSGNIIKKYDECEAGNFVKKGTKLLEIDPKDYKMQLDTREAELVQSQKMLKEAKEEFAGATKSVDLARRDYQIAQSEFERNQRIKSALSSAEFDQSKRNLLNVETAFTNRKNSLSMIAAKLERMQASIDLAKSQKERAKLNITRSTVVAPDNGIIVSESVQEGEFVNPGSELLTFEDTRRSEVICNLTPRDLAWIRENSPVDEEAAKKIAKNKALAVYYLPKTRVSVFEPENESIVWEGSLERFDGIGRDNRTRTIPTRITVAKPLIESSNGEIHALVRGMFVKCRIKVQVSSAQDGQQFVSFPAVALRPGGFVWTVQDSKLKKVMVDVVDRGEKTVEKEKVKYVVVRLTEDSLQPGDSIVESPIAQPKDGLVVELGNSSANAITTDQTRDAEEDAEGNDESPE